jgi:hypothetical protein
MEVIQSPETDYTALYPRRWQHSKLPLDEIEFSLYLTNEESG